MGATTIPLGFEWSAWDSIQFRFVHLPLHSNPNDMVVAPIFAQSVCIISFNAQNAPMHSSTKSKTIEFWTQYPRILYHVLLSTPIRANTISKRSVCSEPHSIAKCCFFLSQPSRPNSPEAISRYLMTLYVPNWYAIQCPVGGSGS